MALETVDVGASARLVSPEPREEDFDAEATLRPKTLEEYIGQDKATENLRVYLKAAKLRGEPLDHLLLYGPPALAKPRWPALWRTRWACRFASPRARPLKNRAIWPRC